MEIVAEIQNDMEGDNEILLAATQYENTNANATITTMMAKKKMSPRKPVPTFARCTFGSVGTINIHIHKH